MERVLKIGIYVQPNKRSQTVCDAMQRGIHKNGDKTALYKSGTPGDEIHGAAVFYGLSNGNQKTMERYLSAGKETVYIDLGYWHRKVPDRLSGYHRFSINGLHPTFQLEFNENPDRFAKFKKTYPNKYDPNGPILLAGMSAKAARVYGLKPEEWERETILKLKSITDRQIIYRPKPSWEGAAPIEGVCYDEGSRTIDKALAGVSCLVTHHSNAAIDAMLLGIPSYCPLGPLGYLQQNRIEDINSFKSPSAKAVEEATNALSYIQWNLSEMRLGTVWAHIRSRYLCA